MRILICDDNREAATALTQLLKLNGHDATPCFDGAACLQHAINWRPHAALLDIGMPFMDGWEVARNLRQLDIGHPIVLIAVTNHDEPKHRARSIAAGFDAHLAKPPSIERILEILRSGR
jgi:CheY-like chemotaxis protein